MKAATAVLFVDSLFAAKRSILEINHRPDGLGYNDVAIVVNELQVSKRYQLDIRLTNRFNPCLTSVRQ